MHKKVIMTVGSLVISWLLASPAWAGFYLAGYAGGAFPGSPEATFSTTVTVDSLVIPVTGVVEELSLDNAVVFGGKLGYWFEPPLFPPPFHFGLEVDALHFDAHFTADLTPTIEASAASDLGLATTETGDLDVTVVGLNLLYRIPGILRTPRIPQGRLQPYVGVGPSIAIVTEDTDLKVGVQALAGVRLFLFRALALFAEYKFLHNELNFQLDDVEVETELNIHLLVGGVSLHF